MGTIFFDAPVWSPTNGNLAWFLVFEKVLWSSVLPAFGNMPLVRDQTAALTGMRVLSY